MLSARKPLGHADFSPCRRYREGRYVRVYAPQNQRAVKGYVYEHVLVAERALGRPLPSGAEVHHWDGDGENNEASNLLICPNHSYHMLIERRQRALAECGHPDWFKCGYCGKYDAPENLYVYTPRERLPRGHHHECRRIYNQRRWREERK